MINSAILGCTGIVGQTFLWMLDRHPVLNPVSFIASDKKHGKNYLSSTQWMLPVSVPESLNNAVCESFAIETLKEKNVKIVFSALPASVASVIEPVLVEHGFYVFSNASALRGKDNVPLCISDVNPHSMDLIYKQGYPEKGFVVTNPNCSTSGLVTALAPLKQFGIKEIFFSSYQSVSGAGYPGLSSMDIMNNVIPYIGGEEEKIIRETQSILEFRADCFPFAVRVPVPFGHLETVWLRFNHQIHEKDIIDAWESFSSNKSIYSLPERPVIYQHGQNFPQPRYSFEGEPQGMSVYTGRLKKIKDTFGFVCLVNNIVRGAAGTSVANAEYFLETYV